MRRIAVLALTALSLVATASASAATARAPVFGLRAVGNPKLGYFVYTMAPGSAHTGAVIVSNVGTASGTVKLFTADGTTGQTSGTVYKTDSAPTAAGAWVQLSQTSFTLAPGAHRQVSFTVHVPSSAKSGQWVGGIVAETSHRTATQKPGQKAHVQITIRDLTIVAVQVNIPGPPVISLSVGKVTTGGSKGFQKVFIQLTNTGNVLIKPQGSVTILDASGRVVETLPFTLDTFLPHTSIDYPVLLKKALTAGNYRAVVHITVPGVSGASAKIITARPAFSVSNADVKKVFTSSQPTQAPPAGAVGSSSSGLPTWAYAAAAAALVVLLLLLLWLLVHRRRSAGPTMPPETLLRLPPLPPVHVTEPEPAPAPVPLPPPVAPEPPPVAPAQAPAPPAPTPVTAAPAPGCDPHYWEVAYDRGVLGEDGVWRFPHRCRTCGLELNARDIADASAIAAQYRS